MCRVIDSSCLSAAFLLSAIDTTPSHRDGEVMRKEMGTRRGEKPVGRCRLLNRSQTTCGYNA
jgi:hypothetical protein